MTWRIRTSPFNHSRVTVTSLRRLFEDMSVRTRDEPPVRTCSLVSCRDVDNAMQARRPRRRHRRRGAVVAADDRPSLRGLALSRPVAPRATHDAPYGSSGVGLSAVRRGGGGVAALMLGSAWRRSRSRGCAAGRSAPTSCRRTSSACCGCRTRRCRGRRSRCTRASGSPSRPTRSAACSRASSSRCACSMARYNSVLHDIPLHYSPRRDVSLRAPLPPSF